MRARLFLILCGLLTFSFTAKSEEVLSARVLNGERGFIGAARNLKIAVEVPQEKRNRSWTRDNFSVYVYPRNTAPENALIEKYRAKNLFVWNLGNHIFIDARTLPDWENFGDYAATVVVENNSEKSEIPAQGTITYLPEKTDVVMLIDVSGSMRKNDPEKKRRQAANAFLQMATHDGRVDRVGVVLFNENSEVAADLTPPAQNEKLQNALNKINAQGQTNIGKALLQAAKMLQNSKRAAVILLTDGKNESATYADEHRILADLHIPVYAVGLSNSADQEMLSLIAQATGGRSFWTANGADLVAIYLDIAAELGNQATILGLPIREPQIVDIPVDETIDELCFLLDDPLANFRLLPPKEVSPNLIQNYTGKDFIEYRIKNPPAGLWRAQINNQKPVKFLVTARTAFFLDTFPPVATAQGWTIGATLADQGLVVDNSRVIVASNGERFTLFDDGEHFDGAMNDGIYTGVIPYGNDRNAKPAKIFAENGNQYRRENIIIEWNKNFTLAEQISGHVDFGEHLVGSETSIEAKLFYNGPEIQGSLRFLEMNLTSENSDESFYALRNLKIPRHFRLQIGENSLPLKLLIPEDLSAGIYRGELLAHTNGLNLPIPVTLKIKNPLLQISPTEFDVGYVTAGKPLSLTAHAKFDGNLPATINLSTDQNLFPVAIATEELTSSENEISLTLATAADLPSGEYQVPVKISVGGIVHDLTVKMQIPERGESVHSALIGHELIFPSYGEVQHALLPVHELTPFFPTRERVAKIYLHELHLTFAPPIAPEIESETKFLPQKLWWLVFVIFGGAIILLCVRRMVQNRFLRFALLSMVIHLPLLGFLATYFFSSKVELRKPLSTMLVNLTSPENDLKENSALTEAEFITEKILANTLVEDNRQIREFPLLAQISFNNDENSADYKNLSPQIHSDATFNGQLNRASKADFFAPQPVAHNQPINRTPESAEFFVVNNNNKPNFDQELHKNIEVNPAFVFQENKIDHDNADLYAKISDIKNTISKKNAVFHNENIQRINSPRTEKNPLPMPDLSGLERQHSTIKRNNIPTDNLTLVDEINTNINSIAAKTELIALDFTEAKFDISVNNEDLNNVAPIRSDISKIASTTSPTPDFSSNYVPNVQVLTKTVSKNQKTELNTVLPNEQKLLSPVREDNATTTDSSEIAQTINSQILADRNSFANTRLADFKEPQNKMPPQFLSDKLTDTNFSEMSAVNLNNVSSLLKTNKLEKSNVSAPISAKTVSKEISEPSEYAITKVIPQTFRNHYIPAESNTANEKFTELFVNPFTVKTSNTSTEKISTTTLISRAFSASDILPSDKGVIENKSENRTVEIINHLNSKPKIVDENTFLVKDDNQKLENNPTVTVGKSRIKSLENSNVNQTTKMSLPVDKLSSIYPTNNQTSSALVATTILNASNKSSINKKTDDEYLTKQTASKLPQNTNEMLSLPSQPSEISKAKASYVNENSSIYDRSTPDEIGGIISNPKKQIYADLNPLKSQVKLIQNSNASKILTADKHSLSRDNLESANTVAGNSAESTNISFSIGIIGMSSEMLDIKNSLSSKQVALEKIAFTDDELKRCSLVIISEKDSGSYSRREIDSLIKYLIEGGKIWLHNCNGFPSLYQTNFDIRLLTKDEIKAFEKGKNTHFFSLQGLFYNGNLLAIASDGGAQNDCLFPGIEYLMNKNVFEQNSAKTNDNSFTLWQNFSNIDPQNSEWNVNNKGNTAKISFDTTADHNTVLHLKISENSNNRIRISYTVPDNLGRRIDLSAKTAHFADIYNAQQVPVEISVSFTNQIGNDWDEFETEQVSIAPGWNRQVQFDLTKMKSRKLSPQVEGMNKCAKITYHVHQAIKNELLFDNLGWK